MKKSVGKFLAVVLVCVLVSGLFAPIRCVSAATLPTDVKKPSSGCVMIGIKGSYLGGSKEALDRINEIRKEACREGVINPATGEKLKPSDYVSIKWSADLEYIARIRAAEAAVTMAHIRTNGMRCFDLTAPNGMQSWGEVLAWNWDKSMVYGVNQWYEEKADWVKQNQNAVTGHYTAMIDPNNTFVGLGAFYSSEAPHYPNSVAGEFSSNSGIMWSDLSLEDISQKKAKSVKDCTQKLELSEKYMEGLATRGEVRVGKKSRVYAVVGGQKYPLYQGTWTSSDKSVLTVDQNGKITPKKEGTAIVSVKYDSLKYKLKIKVKN